MADCSRVGSCMTSSFTDVTHPVCTLGINISAEDHPEACVPWELIFQDGLLECDPLSAAANSLNGPTS